MVDMSKDRKRLSFPRLSGSMDSRLKGSPSSRARLALRCLDSSMPWSAMPRPSSEVGTR
jgi:hypothetical protein